MSGHKSRPKLTPVWLPYIREKLADWESAHGLTITPDLKNTPVSKMLAATWNGGDSLRVAPIWWVSRDMTTLATDTAIHDLDFPRVDPPSDTGFIVFEGGIPAPPLDCFPDGSTCTVDAMKWTVYKGLNSHGKPCAPIVEFYTREPAFVERCVPGLPLAYVLLHHQVRLPLAVRILWAVWTLSAQPGISDTHAPRTTPLDRVPARYERTEIPRVKMLVLRENLHRPGAKAEPGETTREWTHRWIVRGFWREQPYGKDHALRRRQWIPPYVKGPADKPLITKETVRIWRR